MKKIFITGFTGKNPELRVDSNSGMQFATFSVGVSVGTKQTPKTDWVDVSCNGKLADIAKNHIKKGSKLLIEGYPSASAYINKENKAVATLKVFANNIEFLSRQEDNSTSNNNSVSNLTSDEVPF